MAEDVFTWRGKKMVTIGDLSDAMLALTSPEEARQFRDEYRLTNANADANLGYLTGYYGAEEAQRMREWLDVSHPIFGRESPSPEQALEAGRRMASTPTNNKES